MRAPLVFKGSPGSPYTRKMMALMRYRHIPYRYLVGEAADRAGMPKPPVELLPTFYLPDAQGQVQALTDSTPLLRRLEREVPVRLGRRRECWPLSMHCWKTLPMSGSPRPCSITAGITRQT